MVSILKMLLKPRKFFKFIGGIGTILILISLFSDELLHTSTRLVLTLGFRLWLLGVIGSIALSKWFQSWLISNLTVEKISKPKSLLKIVMITGILLFITGFGMLVTLFSNAKFVMNLGVVMTFIGFVGQIMIKYNLKLRPLRTNSNSCHFEII